jgi:hypothetical protein
LFFEETCPIGGTVPECGTIGFRLMQQGKKKIPVSDQPDKGRIGPGITRSEQLITPDAIEIQIKQANFRIKRTGLPLNRIS